MSPLRSVEEQFNKAAVQTNKVKDEGKKTKKELSHQMKSSQFWTNVFKTLALIGFYYFASIGLTFYQSWLLKVVQREILNTLDGNPAGVADQVETLVFVTAVKVLMSQ